ncbi:MAG: hypothetical protein ACKOCD_10525 [Nitrospiraceae bacterium]
MPKPMTDRHAKRPQAAPPHSRQGSSRQGKKSVLERIKEDTSQIQAGSLMTALRKQGYEELPLEEIQDRLSKLRTSLAEFIVSRRG